jgi:sec-independent protein translocase protein TatC
MVRSLQLMAVLRPIGHEDRLSLVDHLDELRGRLIVCAAVLGVAFAVCLWQNHALLKIINAPLKTQTRKQVAKGEGTVGQAVLAQQALLKVASDTQSALALLSKQGSGVHAPAREELAPLASSLRADVAKVPRNPPGDNPVTLGVGEPFTTTVTVALYFALVFSLPVILYQLYGFLLPALKPDEQRVAVPLLAAIPALFVIGVLFGYFVVLPAAVRFFVNFNSSEFNVLVQASQFYKFAATILLAMGLVFQVPVAILAATRLEIVTPRQLRKNRRYAILACAVVAAFLPGDAVTLVLETVPLYLLYEVSILVASLLGRSGARRAQEGELESAGVPAKPPEPDANPTVQQLTDHVDRELEN